MAAFPDLKAIPQNINISVVASKAAALMNDILISVIPTLQAGTVFDCTNAVSCAVYVDNQLPGSLNKAATLTGVLVSHDATGMTFSLASSTNLAAILAFLSGNFPVTVTITDSIPNEVIVGTGYMSVNNAP